MDNWNFRQETEFVASIEDNITRTMTSVFLNQLVLRCLKRVGPPEADFDLLFFVKVVSNVAGDHRLIRMCLDGKPLDVGWEGLADAFPSSPVV